jgi:nitrite reductase (NADH) large subunit
MAGLRTVEELLAQAPDLYDITIFGAEPHLSYNRILLSAVLAGEKTLGEIIAHPRSWYDERGIALIAGDPVAAIDRGAKTICSAGRIVLAYDKLLLATGSKPLALPFPGLELPGVCAVRDIADVVTVVHLMPILMERQLDAAAAELLRRDLASRGIDFVLNGETEEILGNGHAAGIRLADGREIAADLVLLAIGTRPNIDLARAAGLDLNRGIAVGDDLGTSDPAIYAVGECVEHNGQTFGLVAPLWEQAKICAARLAGDRIAAYRPPPVSTSLKITGIDVFSAGTLTAVDDSDDTITLSDAAAGFYKKLLLREDRLVGCVLYGNVIDGPWYVELIQAKRDVSGLRDGLVFGRELAEEPMVLAPQSAAA